MLRGALLPALWFSASDVRFTVAANLVKFLYSDKKTTVIASFPVSLDLSFKCSSEDTADK